MSQPTDMWTSTLQARRLDSAVYEPLVFASRSLHWLIATSLS